MRIARAFLARWIPLAVLAVALGGLAYLLAQQVMRQGANDPQIQMAEDAAASLAGGADTAAVLPPASVDVGRSLAPFVIVYGQDQTPIATSGLLHGQVPALPAGVLDSASARGQSRVTWQPEPGVRLAAVVVPYGGAKPGFVLAGRSPREVESRAGQLLALTALALAVTLGSLLIAVALGEWLLRGERKTL